jgi:hypothetical protein
MVRVNLRLRIYGRLWHRTSDFAAFGAAYRTASSPLHRVRPQGLPRYKPERQDSGLETSHFGNHPSYTVRVWAYSSSPEPMGIAFHYSRVGTASSCATIVDEVTCPGAQ